MGFYDQFEVEDHPFGSFIPEGPKSLIIGSFPTHRRNYKRTFKFYYAGVGNAFWPVMEGVFNKHFHHDSGDEAVEERKEFLRQKRIGITDMLLKCYRHQGRSQDEHIFPIKYNDIFGLLEKYPEIKTIVLTGRQPVIGPLGLFETYFYQKDASPPKLQLNPDKVLEGSFARGERHFEVLVPYSTSRTVIEKQRTTERELISMYSCCLT